MKVEWCRQQYTVLRWLTWRRRWRRPPRWRTVARGARPRPWWAGGSSGRPPPPPSWTCRPRATPPSCSCRWGSGAPARTCPRRGCPRSPVWCPAPSGPASTPGSSRTSLKECFYCFTVRVFISTFDKKSRNVNNAMRPSYTLPFPFTSTYKTCQTVK